jgi:AhpD family alkylhydroperoxidase
MKNPAILLPEAMPALMQLDAVSRKTGIPKKTIDLVHLRVSQINGCGVCVDMHWRLSKKDGETDDRLHGVAAWREMPYYTDPERAALALGEALARISDRPDAVPDAIWQEVARHFDEPQLAGLVLSIALINVWNRLNVATRQIAGASGW